MNFWIIAIALLVLSAAVMVWPLFTGPAKERITGILIVLIVSLTGLFMYQGIGTPEAITFTWSHHREVIMDQGPLPEGWTIPPLS